MRFQVRSKSLSLRLGRLPLQLGVGNHLDQPAHSGPRRALGLCQASDVVPLAMSQLQHSTPREGDGPAPALAAQPTDPDRDAVPITLVLADLSVQILQPTPMALHMLHEVLHNTSLFCTMLDEVCLGTSAGQQKTSVLALL